MPSSSPVVAEDPFSQDQNQDQDQDHLMKVNNNTLTKEEQQDLLREILPACQPQEGSPANTFTQSELDDLQRAVGAIRIGPSSSSSSSFSGGGGGLGGGTKNATAAANTKTTTKKEEEGSAVANRSSNKNSSIGRLPNKIDIRDARHAFCPPSPPTTTTTAAHAGSIEPSSAFAAATTATTALSAAAACPQDGDYHHCEEGEEEEETNNNECCSSYSYHGGPRFHADHREVSRSFREKVRKGEFISPTNGVCPGFLQCNLVVLPQGQTAFDFLLFCQRNPKACPLIEVCDVGSANPAGVAIGADLRTDVPKYAIYRNGKLEKEVTDATEYWPKNSVAFLIGCSFSYDGALMDAGIPLRSAEQGKNVPMYKTDLRCRPSGSLRGTMVVSMKPIPATLVSKHVEITSRYAHAHGGPVAVGPPSTIGVKDVDRPEWGEPVEMSVGDVPVFHACGVTPQSVLMDAEVPFAITHSPGYMFVTDLPSDMGV